MTANRNDDGLPPGKGRTIRDETFGLILDTSLVRRLTAANDNYKIGDELIRGASDLADYLYSDRTQRRRIYYLADSTSFPIFRMGSMLCALKSAIDAWIAEQSYRHASRKGAPAPSPTIANMRPEEPVAAPKARPPEPRHSTDIGTTAASNSAPNDDDGYIYTAANIADYLFGDRSLARRVYHLVATSNLPITSGEDGVLRAHPSELKAWIAKQKKGPRGSRS